MRITQTKVVARKAFPSLFVRTWMGMLFFMGRGNL